MKHQIRFSGKVGIQQRTLPNYRVAFFDRLAEKFSGRVELFAGEPMAEERIQANLDPQKAFLRRAKNLHFTCGKLYSCWQQGMISWLCQYRPDVLILEANPRLLSNYFSICLMKVWRRPVIGWGLGVLEREVPKWMLLLRKRALSRFYNFFDVLIAYSNKGSSDYQKLGFPDSKIFVAPNSVSSEDADRLFRKIDQNPELIAEWKTKCELSDKPIVLYAGRLLPQKRVKDLIQACSRLGDILELVIVGNGQERLALESLAAKVLPKTKFLGHLQGEELALCYTAADLFVLPGSGGLAIQEAMIYGKSIITSSGDGTQYDLVREGKNGFHIKAGDIFTMARRIETCIKDRSLLYNLGQESRRIVEEEYNLEVMVQVFVEALNFVFQR